MLATLVSLNSVWAANNHKTTKPDTTCTTPEDSDVTYAYYSEQLADVYKSNTSTTLLESASGREFLAEEFEVEIELEEWMLSPNHESWYDELEVDKEDDIKLEDWMVDVSQWN
jgi:hypothetical protein